jgi:alpha 1,2-mannosyltransferase
MPKNTADTLGATSVASSVLPKSLIRFTRRRYRIIVLIVVLVSIISGLLIAVPHGNRLISSPSSSSKDSSTTNKKSIFNSLFDIDDVNKYFNNINKATEKESEKKHEIFAILKQVNAEEEALLNDADQLKKLYLNIDHNGIVNYGSTGNMAKPELNIIQNKDSKLLLGKINPENKKEKSAKDMKKTDNDRTTLLSNLIIPDEDAFNKIKPEEFIKGDLTSKNFFSYILNLISHNHLSFPLKRRMNLENGKPVIDNVLFYEDPYERLSESDLYEKFEFPQNFIDDLKIKHETVVKSIPDISPNFYSGDGYVVVGGGIYSWYALLGIETLRKVGSIKPVEVFLPEKKDYEYDFCEKILPKLNARCIEMYRIFSPQSLKNFDIQGYQYKAFALLGSSFENAFLLDSDCFPVTNPDILFESKLYKDYKMITWPDLWRRTTSPLFYEISDTKVGMTPVRHLNDFFVNPKFLDYKQGDDVTTAVTYHDRAGTIPDWATESGEMLINKKKHFKTLILSLYYNHDGPYGYYPLLSQGGAGEGDKETFVAAANFYGFKYYQVNKKPERFFGWFNHVQNYEHSTIVQYNPLEDYDLLLKTQTKLRQDMETQGESFEYKYDNYFSQVFTSDALNPMFYHVHDPKMNPFKIMENRWTENLDGQKIRNLGEDFPRINFDLEMFIWGTINHYICEMKIPFNAFDGANWGSLCNDFIGDQLEYLKKSSSKIYAAYTPSNVGTQMSGGRIWD